MTAQDIQPYALDERARELLRACDLPTSDLDTSASLRLYGCTDGAHVLGLVGLELYGEVALLRSLAVDPAARGQGHARALVRAAEQAAAEAGVRHLYLLTTTAAPFFAALGYANAERTNARGAIAATPQFSGLCPASSSFMMKTLSNPRAYS